MTEILHQVEILIVDDSMEDAELAIRALKKNHLSNTIIHLIDGAEALDFIFAKGEYEGRNGQALPKIVLLDLKMPRVNGLEVLATIKSDPFTRSMPVVVLTSSAEDPDIKRCYDLGANSYIVKPVDFNNFSRTISDLGLYWLVLNRQ